MPGKPSETPPARTSGPAHDAQSIAPPEGDALVIVEALRRRVATLESQLASAVAGAETGRPPGAIPATPPPSKPTGSENQSEQALTHGVFLLDAAGAVVGWNDAALRIAGCTPLELRGRDSSCFYQKSEIAAGKPLKDLERVATHGSHEEEILCTRNSGDSFWATIVLTALRDEHRNLQGYARLIQDSTARKRRESRRRLMVELALNAMVLVDRQGTILQVNPQTDKMFGYAPEELHGQTIEVLVPESLSRQHAGYRDAFFANPLVRSMGVGRDLYGRRKDGSQFPVEIGLNPVHTDDGLLVLSSIVDISERKLAQERSRMHLSEIAHAGRLTTVGEMFSGLAHEINQPLAAAANFVRAGLRSSRSPAGVSQEQLIQWMEKVGGQVSRAIDIVTRVGTFVKKDRSAHGIVDLNEVIADVLELPALGIGPGPQEISPTFFPAPELPGVFADRRQIEQVLVNLVRNAIESMTHLPHAERRLTIRTAVAGDKVEVSVADAGHGIAAEHMERLFSPFFTTKDDGMGLGLSISRSIVEAHTGRLWADSRPGEGASFYFSLPIADRETPS